MVQNESFSKKYSGPVFGDHYIMHQLTIRGKKVHLSLAGDGPLLGSLAHPLHKGQKSPINHSERGFQF